MTLVRAANAPKAKVALDGAALAGPKDFAQGQRTLRLELPLTPHVAATLQVSTVGQGALSFRVQGIVAEADLPAGAGQRVAPDLTLAQLELPAGSPVQVPVTLPTDQGLFELRAVPGPGLRGGDLTWDAEAPFKALRDPANAAVQVAGTAHTVQADLRGDAGSSLALAVVGSVVDEAAPSVSWTQPADGATVDEASALVATFADALSGIRPAGTRISVDGQDVTSAFALTPSGASAQVGALPAALRAPGTHALQIRVEDHACNEATAQVAFVIAGVDMTPPVV